MNLTIRKIDLLKTIPVAAWNKLDLRDNPFLTHQFLSGLEEYIELDLHGWFPCHLIAETDGEIVAALLLYIKTNSIGEFVFDWNWAEYYERTGNRYYPKLVSAIPFTPVTGPRCLIRKELGNPASVRNALIREALAMAKKMDLSGIHVLFPDNTDKKIFFDQGMLIRHDCHYQWFNNDYQDFDGFLSCLNAKKRKQIKRERQAVKDNEIRIEVLQGRQITPEHWQVYYDFYTSTFYRKWGDPRLTLEFFQSLSNNLPDLPVLFLASYNNKYVAGAFAMQGNDTLFGRHWGCNRQFPFLHFELCYYQTINYCIQHRLKKLDAGVQGEHKISRGFVPVLTCSAHWIADADFHFVIKHHLEREKKYISDYMNEVSRHLAYKVI